MKDQGGCRPHHAETSTARGDPLNQDRRWARGSNLPQGWSRLAFPVASGLKWRGSRGSLVAQMLKNPPTMQETWVRSLGQRDPLEEGKETHSSILAWRIPWTEEPGGIQSMGLQTVRHDWVTNHSTQAPTGVSWCPPSPCVCEWVCVCKCTCECVVCVCVSEWEIWNSPGCCRCHLPLLCAPGESLTSANLSVLICKTGNDSFAIRINWESIHTAVYNVWHNCGFLRRILVFLDALHSHIHFKTSLSISVKNCVGLALCSAGENWNLYHAFSAQDRGIFFLDLIFTSFQEGLKGLEHLLLDPFPEQSIVLDLWILQFSSLPTC